MEKLRMGVKCDNNDSPVASETVWHDAPHSWTRTSLRHVSRLQYGDSLADAERQEGDISVFGSNGPVGYHNQANMIAPAIVVGRKGSFGKVTFAPFGGFAIDTTYFIDKRSSRQNLRWLYYSLTTLGLDQISQDTGVPGLSREKAYEARLAVPPLPTQRAIADYLDEKTSDLDALIEKKRKLLDLLAEERAVLINQTVTKGLDSNVPMKDSGIPWLGEIPAHWGLVAISWYANIFNGATPSRSRPDFWNGTLPWLSSGKVNDWIISEASEFITAEAVRDAGLTKVPSGAVVIGMVGQGRTRGMSARLQIAAYINQNMAAIMPRKGLDASFLHYALMQSYKSIREYGRGGQQDALNCEIVGDIRIPFPPADEQVVIAEGLDKQAECQRDLKVKLEQQLDRLQEYRQALITAAVTGQLDIGAAA